MWCLLLLNTKCVLHLQGLSDDRGGGEIISILYNCKFEESFVPTNKNGMPLNFFFSISQSFFFFISQKFFFLQIQDEDVA